MQAKLYEEKLVIVIERQNDDTISQNSSASVNEDELVKENSIHDISKMDFDNEKKPSKKKVDQNELMVSKNDEYKSINIDKVRIKKKSALSESNIFRFDKYPAKLKKFTSDMNIFPQSNKNKIVGKNSFSLGQKNKTPTKLKLSSFIPPSLTKKLNSEPEIIQEKNHKLLDKKNSINKLSNSKTSSTNNIPNNINDDDDSGWTVVKRKKPLKKKSLSSNNLFQSQKPPKNLSKNNSTTNLNSDYKTPKSHYRDSNNYSKTLPQRIVPIGKDIRKMRNPVD